MKVLLLNKYHYRKGGAERAYFDMAEILERRGHEVAFFSMQNPNNLPTKWSRYFVSEVDYRDQEYSLQEKLKAALGILWNFEANKKLGALIDDFQPDIAHAHNIYHQLSPSIFHILKRKGIPIVLTLHDYKLVSPNYNLYANGQIWDSASGLKCIKDRCIQGSFVKSFVCALEKWLHRLFGSYHLVDRLLSPSAFLATKAKSLGWRGREIEVLPNPLSQEELRGREEVVVPEKDRLVFFGRLSPEKGVGQIFHALVGVPEKNLVVIGEGPEKQALLDLAFELGISSRVTFTGPLYQEALWTELKKAEAVIIPSAWYENLPYVVTESLSRGLVVIAAASGGIVERIQNGENGFLYPLGDTAVLTKILQNLDSFDLPAIRSRARASVSDLAPEAFGSKLEVLYQEVLLEKKSAL